jgi:hypothetical protein
MSFLTKNKKKLLTDFALFACDHLKIKNDPRIMILNGRSEIKTTANYDYTKDEKIIKINGRNRAVVDIMRSIAHELTHHKQWEDGRLKIKPADIASDIENEANAKAGELIKRFALVDNSIYDEEELDEQSTFASMTSPASSTAASATSTTDKDDRYPEVSKWADVVPITRGPGNQIANTKWSETVGQQLKRGPANQLK